MSQQPAALIPQVYVLWHPDCPYGERMARRILQWLRPGNGLGPEVFYRSLPDPAGMVLPSPLPDPLQPSSKGQKSVSNLQVVFMLVDEHMVADWSWRHWLAELAETVGPTRQIMPVALDATAYNMPAKIRGLNYLRPMGLPLAESSSDEAAFEVVARSLLKQITEAMCRLILPRSDAVALAPASSNAPLPKVNVFLSHAKVDGTIPARRLRDYIYSQTQLAAFFDENDIAFGGVFEPVIQRTLESNDTAAMIAVRSAKYASRPWCRRELSMFRCARRDTTRSSGQAPRWRLFPTLVVEALEGSQVSAGIPEFGNSTVIRWTDNDPGLEELIVTTVIRDAMLASFHAALGQSIQSHDKQIVINWLPDPTSLLTIDEVQSGEEYDVLHPGRGLSGLELETLDEFFPRLTFKSFEEALLWG